ncbi:MAG: response regulator transcription factor [Sporichthyaceae bacterium]
MAIVDDAVEIRMLFRAQLAVCADFEVCAEGGTGEEAVEIARRHRPDVMLLDNSMPGMHGIDALPQVLVASPGTAVVILSGAVEPALARRAAELGAAGCLEKVLSAGPLPQRLLELLGA